MTLDKGQRAAIFEKTYITVQKKYFDPKFNGKDWPSLAQASKEKILRIEEPEKFENAMHELVRQLGTSHTGFFHQAVRRVPGRLAISATFRKHETAQGLRWMFQDVHEGGPAHVAGIVPLDFLIAINQRPIVPPEQPTFPMGTASSITVEKRDGRQILINVAVPNPRSRRQPYAEPRSVCFSRLEGEIGYLKATIFPGVLGIDAARELDTAVASLKDCQRLIIDLRGHLGGGLGVLRLMSYLTPGRMPIGYTVTRRRAERGYDKEHLRRFGRIPSSKLAIPFLALQFAGRDESVAIFTEGLGPQKFHGRIVLLVNEHTASAGEMVCGFGLENKLATIVGTETAGRLLGGKGFKVGHGYLVILPGAAYYTWGGKSFEGHGIVPDFKMEWSPDAVRAGHDNQLEKAIEVVKSL